MRLSPAELSYLFTSLTSSPPLRPDARSTTQYRPYSIQANFLASANASVRLTWGSQGDILVVAKAQITESTDDGGNVIVEVYITYYLYFI